MEPLIVSLARTTRPSSTSAGFGLDEPTLEDPPARTTLIGTSKSLDSSGTRLTEVTGETTDDE
jgi:hypothetical protein